MQVLPVTSHRASQQIAVFNLLVNQAENAFKQFLMELQQNMVAELFRTRHSFRLIVALYKEGKTERFGYPFNAFEVKEIVKQYITAKK